jgi:hypothetical protein
MRSCSTDGTGCLRVRVAHAEVIFARSTAADACAYAPRLDMAPLRPSRGLRDLRQAYTSSKALMDHRVLGYVDLRRKLGPCIMAILRLRLRCRLRNPKPRLRRSLSGKNTYGVSLKRTGLMILPNPTTRHHSPQTSRLQQPRQGRSRRKLGRTPTPPMSISNIRIPRVTLASSFVAASRILAATY